MSDDRAQLDELIDDLAAEQRALEAILALITDQWDNPTHAEGWLVRDQLAHIAALDEAAVLAITHPGEFLATFAAGLQEPGQHEREYIRRGREMPVPGLLAWWNEAGGHLVYAARSLSPADRLPWFGPDMGATSFLTARLMETWSHGLDIADAVNIPRPDTDRLRHICFLGVRTRAWSYQVRGLEPPPLPVRVELTLPSGSPWSAGPETAEDRISGTATDFCRVVSQRRHVDDTLLEVTGAAAIEWMQIAQAFAGPPGTGRAAGLFAPGS